MALWQWISLAVAAAVMCMVVRTFHPQMAALCALAAGLMLVLLALDSVGDVQSLFARLTALGGLQEGYLNALVRVLGVSYTAELAAQICRDLGEGGLGMQVALAGKLCVFGITAPLLISMLEMILELTP